MPVESMPIQTHLGHAIAVKHGCSKSMMRAVDVKGLDGLQMDLLRPNTRLLRQAFERKVATSS